jgi:fumarate hydratase class I
MKIERLDKILSGTGLFSRAEARDRIAAGRVTVDGTAVRRPETKVSRASEIRVDGEPADTAEFVYYMLHKPAGYVSSTEDPRDRTVMELIPEEYRRPGEGPKGIVIDLDKGIDSVRAELTKYPVGTRVNLNGTIIVARDIAHAKLKARLDAGQEMPAYFKDHPILYAGPAKTPEGYPCGSMGPTTANRMDPYVDEFQDHGASLVMIAKGNRTKVVTDACLKHGGFYLGTIGGVAAVLSQSSIRSIECVEYPELGMEAIWKIRVEDFPAFILVDDKGNDFFKNLGL